ncbi:hypothetical protein [Comamonas odontotermitis]|uniref:hypothetical protein n=1 Tax=Comamonas odontotermitis TaxID=379895 RepID=UPI003751505E
MSFMQHSNQHSAWMVGPASFEIAAFGFDGDLLGTATRYVSTLSQRWLTVCSELLEECGEVFRRSMGAQLSHIEIQLTSANGAGLGMFYVNGALALSVGLFRSDSEETESAVLNAFVDSLRNSRVVQAATDSPRPFDNLLQLKKRPLFALVAWPPDELSETDADLVRELSTHFAAAFLCRPPSV